MWSLLLYVLMPVVIIGTPAIMIYKTIRYVEIAGDR
jgi:hypothetical protein